jgi:hypothetical protein
MSTCEACSRVILGTSADPLISTKGLGWKNYHYACASRLWRDKLSTKVSTMKESEKVETGLTSPKVGRGKFFVQCTIVRDGLPAVRLSDFANSLQEAEDYFKRQVSEVSSNGGVHCTISLVLKNGKKTQIDELIHPCSPKEES